MSIYVPSEDREPNVLVVGTMAADAKGQPDDSLVPGRSTPGAVHFSIGGVGRNIAETLARLGVRTTLSFHRFLCAGTQTTLGFVATPPAIRVRTTK